MVGTLCWESKPGKEKEASTPRGGSLSRKKEPPSEGAEALGVGPFSGGGDLKREVKISVLLDMFESQKSLFTV